MRFFATILFAIFTVLGLSCNNDITVIEAIKTDSLIVPTDSTTLYIPYPLYSKKDTIRDLDGWADSLTVRDFSYLLFKFGEPIIKNYGGKKNIYRFIWSRTFHAPVCIRIENLDTSVQLNLKVLDGMGGYDFGNISQDTTINVTKDKWDTFISLVDNAGFWKMQNIKTGVVGRDGANWLLEGMQHENYHWVERWAPHKSDFAKACQYLVSISPLRIKESEIY